MENLQIFSSLAAAIFLEAAPFLLIGSLLASLLEVYADENLIARLVPKSRVKGILFGLSIGLLLPTCECGIVPVVRRMLDKGVPASTAITYMLSAPVINPIVMVSTYVAFRSDVTMVLGRVALVALPAISLGWVLSEVSAKQLLLNPSSAEGHAACCSSCCSGHHKSGSKLLAVCRHTVAEFMDMGKFLLLGALVTALFKTFAPASILGVFESNTLVSIAMMMLLAMLLSVCSEADAFVAASFSTISPAAQLAFVGIGPMVDLKLIAMFAAVFQRRVVLALIVVPIFMVYGLSAIFSMFLG